MQQKTPRATQRRHLLRLFSVTALLCCCLNVAGSPASAATPDGYLGQYQLSANGSPVSLYQTPTEAETNAGLYPLATGTPSTIYNATNTPITSGPVGYYNTDQGAGILYHNSPGTFSAVGPATAYFALGPAAAPAPGVANNPGASASATLDSSASTQGQTSNSGFYGSRGQYSNIRAYGYGNPYGNASTHGTSSLYGNRGQYGSTSYYGNRGEYGSSSFYGNRSQYGYGASYGNRGQYGYGSSYSGNRGQYGNGNAYGYGNPYRNGNA